MKKLILLSIMICLSAWSMDDPAQEGLLVFPAASYMFCKLNETQRYVVDHLNILPFIQLRVLSRKEVIEQIDKAIKIYEIRQDKVYLCSKDINETTNAIIKTGTIIHTPPPKL